MNIKSLRSDKIYRKILQAPKEEKVELYRKEMLAPFMGKWEIQYVPFK
ncbi:Zn-dependent protease, partial [Bacillus wiedmannii]